LALLPLQGKGKELNGLGMVESYVNGDAGAASGQPTSSVPGWSTSRSN